MSNTAQDEPQENSVKAIFEDVTEEFAEAFKDQVRALHEHFDEDKDGFLNMKELAALQLATDGSRLTEQNYLMACKALACDPNQGIPVPALKITYLAEGSDLEKDYFKVFPERRPQRDDEFIYEADGDEFDVSG